ncbi:MAG: class I SAM-dependent methyltransferase [Candidatus Aerophobus sp.]|nr:MAG: class I SAM-dependent methyltransferase [Candidatus Aerophobus sp.]
MSTPEEYKEESELFHRVIKEYSKIHVKTLLHLGCGGGRNDYTFKKHFMVTGLDISEDMLKLARELNPEATYFCGDMRTVRLGKLFDAVTIPDSINYMKSEEDLRSVFFTAYEHLKPGGVFLILIEETLEKFKQNRTTSSIHSQGDIQIVFIENSYDPDPNDTTFETTFIFLVRRRGELEIFTDRHLGGIFKLETWHNLLKEIGFEVKQMKFEHSTFAEGEKSIRGQAFLYGVRLCHNWTIWTKLPPLSVVTR